jgi:hypothetical protein
MSRHKGWKYTVHCQECGLDSMSATKSVYRCKFCGSLDLDVSDGWDEYLEKYSERHEDENGVSQ